MLAYIRFALNKLTLSVLEGTTLLRFSHLSFVWFYTFPLYLCKLWSEERDLFCRRAVANPVIRKQAVIKRRKLKQNAVHEFYYPSPGRAAHMQVCRTHLCVKKVDRATSWRKDNLIEISRRRVGVACLEFHIDIYGLKTDCPKSFLHSCTFFLQPAEDHLRQAVCLLYASIPYHSRWLWAISRWQSCYVVSRVRRKVESLRDTIRFFCY